MRDSNRIPKVLSSIERLWQQYPDWRLGQLLTNIADWADESVRDLEDDALVAEIERHLKQLPASVETEVKADKRS